MTMLLWREFPELWNGAFVDHNGHPWLEGRLHDFSGKCPIGSPNAAGCYGAVLTHYTLNVPEAYEWYYKFQKNRSDPYSYWALGEGHDDDLILPTHRKFLQVLVNRSVNIPEFNVSKVPLPSGTVVVVWSSHSNDYESSVRPSFGCLLKLNKSSTIERHDDVNIYDPEHGARNIMMKPIDDLDIYLANTDYSGGCGWADPALILTERILYHHLQSPIPEWVSQECNDCETGSLQGEGAEGELSCSACVSRAWWRAEITSFPDRRVTTRCDAPSATTMTCDGEDCTPTVKNNNNCWQQPQQFQTECQQQLRPFNDFEVVWNWINSTFIEITFKANASSWAGFGVGESMDSAEMVVAWVDRQNDVRSGHFRSSAHVRPNEVPRCCSNCKERAMFYGQAIQDSHSGCSCGSNCSYISITRATHTNGKFQVTFRRPITPPPRVQDWAQSLVVVPGQLTNILFARSTGDVAGQPPIGSFEIRHDFAIKAAVGFYCGREKSVTWDDVKVLFRKKDRDGMLWRFDLWDCKSVAANSGEIIPQIEAKTIYGLTQGMPIDITWPIQDLLTLKSWNRTRSCPDSNCTPAGQNLTFWNDIKPLFRKVDRDAMIFMLDLWKYDDVKKNQESIYKQVADGSMPCGESGGKWSATMKSTFKSWVDCGMKEGQNQEEAPYTDREFFYLMLNVPSHKQEEGFFDKARIQMNYYNGLAAKEASNKTCSGPYNELFSFFNYSEEAFAKRLDLIYQQKVKHGNEYNVDEDPAADTKDKTINIILQRAPFSLVDGVEILQCCPTGPIDDVRSLLWGILNEEIGGGDPSLNHCSLYDNLLRELGIFLPPVSTYEFAHDPRLIDSAFTQPAYKAGLAALNDELFPEMLGTALQIEWCVPDLEAVVKRCDRYGINKKFFTMHIGIDNAAAGHGWKAKKAVMIYLDQIRSSRGEIAVQAEFRRIWTGFLAMAAMGHLQNDVNKMNVHHSLNTDNLEQRVIDMFTQKATYGSQNHRTRRLGSGFINSLFSDPAGFVALLKNSSWIVPGQPDRSPFMNYLITFSGPMYKIFTDDELNLWRNWIVSLDHYHSTEDRTGKLDSYDPDYMLRALVEPRNNLITPGNWTTSRFVTGALSGKNKMAEMFANTLAYAEELDDENHPDKHWSSLDILKRWIQEGCPFEQLPGHTYKLFSEKPVAHHLTKPLAFVYGRGEAH